MGRFRVRRQLMPWSRLDALHHWRSAVDSGQSIRTMALDQVDHNILVAKLLAFGLPDVTVWSAVATNACSVTRSLKLSYVEPG